MARYSIYGAGGATVAVWKLGLGTVVPVDVIIPATCVNLLVFSIMRLFDGPHNVYDDPNDPYAQVLKETEQTDARHKTKASKTVDDSA